MFLRNIQSALPSNIIEALENLGIKTDEDLLIGDVIEIWQKVSDESISLQDLTDARSLVASQQAAPIVRADVLLGEQSLQRETREDNVIFCGVNDLDNLVGGFGQHRVLEFSGDKGTGKTILALQVCVQHLAARPDSGAVWIDTTGEFSIDSVPRAMLLDDATSDLSVVLGRLQVSLAFDLEALQVILETLEYSLNLDPSVRCIVIDNVTSLFRPMLSVTSSQGHSIMITFMRRLRLFAETHGLTIIVINSTSMATPRNLDSNFEFTNRKPALGPSFTYMTDATIWLSQADQLRRESSEDKGTIHTAEILRSRFAPSKIWCPFKIIDGALRPFAAPK